MTKQLLEEGESCCYVTLCCLISLFFMFTSGCHNSCREVEYCGAPLYTVGSFRLTPDHSSPFIFLFFSLSGSAKAKELKTIRIEEENALNLNSNCNLLSAFSAHPYEGKQINLSSSDIEADSWRLMSLPYCHCHFPT